MFRRESIEENYQKIKNNTEPTDYEKETLKNTINRLSKDLQLELFSQWFVNHSDYWAQCDSSVMMNLEILSVKDYYELVNSVIFILDTSKRNEIVIQETLNKEYNDMSYSKRIQDTEITCTKGSGDNYKGIYDNIINQQKQYKDAPIIEDENYLSYFNIDRKDIMKIK